MTTSALATAIIIIGATILVLGSVPTKNTIEDNTLTVHFLIGKKVIDITGAKFLPVPDDIDHHLIRTNGTSLGKKHSGHFKNTRTKNTRLSKPFLLKDFNNRGFLLLIWYVRLHPYT